MYFSGKESGIRDFDEQKCGMRDFREKGAGMRDQAPLPPPPPPLPDPQRTSEAVVALVEFIPYNLRK